MLNASLTKRIAHPNVNRWLTLVVAIVILIALENHASASCGDYVILTGEVPAHLRTDHLQNNPRKDQSNLVQQRLSDFPTFPALPIKCSGPGCGQGKDQTTFTQPIMLRIEVERNVATAKPCAVSSVLSEQFAKFLPSDSDLPAQAFPNRLDRPPQCS